MRRAAAALAALLFLASPARAEGPKPRPPTPVPWPKPRVLFRAVFEPPFSPGVGATVFLAPRWSVSADLLNRGAFGPFYELGVHYWPRSPRGSHHQLGVGVGGDLLANHSVSSGGFAALFLSSVDIHYLARPLRDLGLVLGGKMGLGVSFEARDFGDHARGGAALDHLGFQLTSYAGVALGSPR